jgi:hypothetical protein
LSIIKGYYFPKICLYAKVIFFWEPEEKTFFSGGYQRIPADPLTLDTNISNGTR